MTAPGWAPADFMVAANATCMANSVGCIRSIPVTTSGAVNASVTENPDSRAMSGSISAMVAANAGSLASSPAPIETHCEPWPENTQTGPRSSWPTAGWYGVSPSATARRASTSSVLSAASTPVRTGRYPRRRASVYARSRVATGPESVRPSIQSASRPEVWRSASEEVADSANNSGAAGSTGAAPLRRALICGACSRTACTLVPDIPYEDTAARRGAPSSWPGHGITCCGTKSSVLIRASSSGSRVWCTIGGTTPCCSDRTALMMPTVPAAASVWPRLLFAEPRAQARSMP